ncbi:MAG: hypothetical protein ABFR63_12490, partial [Thermodesulfobacteriota bacterium]
PVPIQNTEVMHHRLEKIPATGVTLFSADGTAWVAGRRRFFFFFIKKPQSELFLIGAFFVFRDEKNAGLQAVLSADSHNTAIFPTSKGP